MNAVIRSGNKQYRVKPDDIIEVETLGKEAGSTVTLDDVLLVNKEGEVHVGQPKLKNATVVCEVLGTVRARKVVAFKFRKRESYRRKIGHRQWQTRLKVKEIVLQEE